MYAWLHVYSTGIQQNIQNGVNFNIHTYIFFKISIFKTRLEREPNLCLAMTDSKLLAKLFRFSGKNILPMKVNFKITSN